GAPLVRVGGQRMVLALVCDVGGRHRRAAPMDFADDGNALARGWVADALWLPAAAVGWHLRLSLAFRLWSGAVLPALAWLVALAARQAHGTWRWCRAGGAY